MSNTSASGGYLTPPPPQPLEGTALEDFIQVVVVGITGLPGPMVRPRVQPEPPNLPPVGTDWAAVGILRTLPDTYAYEGMLEDDSYQFQRNEIVEFITSFFGPNADSYAGFLRDGLQIAQNREALQLAYMGLVETGEARQVSTLVKDKWLRQIDQTFTINRVVVRTYPVLSFLSAAALLHNEHYDTPITVTE